MTRQIHRPLSGGQYEVTGFRLNPPDEQTVDSWPAEMAAAHRLLVDLEAKYLDTARDLHITAVAIEQAETADAKALGEAIRQGAKDPGPKNTRAAEEAHAEAVRQHAGTEQALHEARRVAFAVASATDFTASVNSLEARAAELIAPAIQELEKLGADFQEYRKLRSFAGTLATFPATGAGSTAEVAQLNRGIQMILEQISLAGPMYIDQAA